MNVMIFSESHSGIIQKFIFSMCYYPGIFPSHTFEFTTLHMIEAMPNKRNPANLIYMKSKYLLMSPYLEGSKFEKISGDTGEISADWRKRGNKLQRITRTLDAFQHYVVAKSDERLLIADLQGKISRQCCAEHVLT